MKNIVICCDGTNNQLNGDLTNVVRMFRVASRGGNQVTYYDPGVGTLPEPTAQSGLKKKVSLLKGLAFGTGFDENVFDAYRYLMQVHEPGDRVFLYGFSRGAFSARVVAGLLHSIGLLYPGAENLLPYIWQYYRAGINDVGAKVCADVKRDMAKDCPIAFLGVWDTVSSVGLYNFNQTFPWTYNIPDAERVRHAVSLDEKRAGFRSNIVNVDKAPLPDQRPRVMNVWFPGVHADVGGGYSREQSGLAMIAFEWMVREARAAGMVVDDERLRQVLAECPPDHRGPMHDELDKIGWKAMELLPARRYNWDTEKTEWRRQPRKPRSLRKGAILHQSVLDRITADSSYRPAALPTHSVPELRAQFQIET